MLQLHYANRFEDLIGPLAGAVDRHQRRDPLVPLPIIVPNRAVEQFARYRIAERLGVAANLDFPFLRRYLAQMVERADPSIRVLEVPRLQVVLFECLRSDAHSGDRSFQPVRDYVAAANPENDRIADLRLFELAGRIAHLFQEYSISRGAMLRAWCAAKAGDESRLSPEERWQRSLWSASFDRDGAARVAWTHDRDHRWMLLPQALAATTDDKLGTGLPQALHVFGLSSPGRVFLEIFARLGKLKDLFVYALNPCMEFWEDVDTSAAVRQAAWHRRAEKVGSALEEREDPFELSASSDTHALQFWGRPGREYIRMLNELTECDFQPHFSHSAGMSLLSRLQDDILVRAPEGSGDKPLDDEPPPQSIRFIGAPGLRREVEIVASEILRVLADGDAQKNSAPMRFHEMAVLVPEASADAYLPHIEAIFESQFGIPVEVVGRRSSASRAGEAIDLLLKFPLGRATRDEVLRLLTHPAIAGAGHEIDTDRLAAWCEELGVFFGTDATDLANTYVPPNLFQWDQALTRLTLGAFMEDGSRGEASFYASEAGNLLPLGLSQDELSGAARFLRTARALLADARDIRLHSLPLSDWARLLIELIGKYIQAADPADQVIRDRCLEALEPMASVSTEPVGYEVAHAFASAMLADVAAHQGGFSGRGVAAGSLGTLRALPFRAIFVMGLNEAAFPERDRRDPLDLRLLRRHPGDITPIERDRYLFLESILAARERIAFSWVERDAQTGDPLYPSSTVRELQSILGDYVGDLKVKGLTTSHPVSRYEQAYFPDIAQAVRADRGGKREQDLVSFDPDARRGARMLALRRQLELVASDSALPEQEELLDRIEPKVRAWLAGSLGLFDLPARSRKTVDEIDLPIAAIRRFLECPMQGAARYALGMVDDDGAPEEASDEPIAQSRIDHAMLLRDAFWTARGDPMAFRSAYHNAIAVAQMKGLAPAGPFAAAAVDADCARFARWCEELGNARNELKQWRVLRIGRGDEFSRADRVLPTLRLDVRILDATGSEVVRRVNLHGSLGAFSSSLDRSLRLVSRNKSKPQDFLELFIAAIALSAAGEPVPREFQATVLGDPASKSEKAAASWTRTFHSPEPAAARRYLSRLIEEMMSRPHDYFLPIEAVADARGAILKGKPVDDAIERIRDGFASCASDYGPVRNSHDYEPPEEPEVRRIIEARFGIIEEIFQDREDA